MRVNGEKRGIDVIFRLSIFLLLCSGAHAWFTWFTNELTSALLILLYGLFTVFAYNYKRIHRIRFHNHFLVVILFLFFIIAHSFPSFGPSVPFVCILQLYPILVLIYDKQNTEENLKFISKGLSIIFIPGMLIWLYVLNTGIPGFPIQFPNDNDHYYFFNYIFCIRIIDLSDGFHRFQSVFLEPGYLGTLIALLLYANRYNFERKYNLINFIVLICSFSLAGYVTFFLGYIYFRIKNKKGIETLIYCSIIILVVLFVGLNYNGGDNYINHMIIERLATDQETGIQGNNRFLGHTNDVYEQAVQKGNILWGDAKIEHSVGGEIDGAGYKIFLLTRGLISALCYLIFYFLIARLTRIDNYSSFFITLIVLTFLQASYPESFSWIIPFVLGCASNRNLKIIKQ